MIALRGNVILVFLKIYLILGFLTIFVFSEEWLWPINKQQAFLAAACTADCDEEISCRNECFKKDKMVYHNSSKRANFNPSLHCKQSDSISIKHNDGIWVIERKTSNGSWNDPIYNTGTLTEITGLEAGTSYLLRAYRVGKNGSISEPEISSSFATFGMDYRPRKIQKLIPHRRTKLGVPNFNNIFFMNINQSIDTSFILEPDSDRSCTYKLIIQIETKHTSQFFLNDLEFGFRNSFKFAVQSMNYNANVTMHLAAYNKGNKLSSDDYSRSFITPTCQQIFGHDYLVKCAPKQVQGLHVKSIVKNSPKSTLVVAWDSPNQFPDKYTLVFQWLNNENEPSVFNRTGRTTEIPFEFDACHGDLRCQIKISIRAESSGIQGPESSIIEYLNEPKNIIPPAFTDIESALFYTGFIFVSATMVILVFVPIGRACVKHLRRRDKSSETNKIYKFCHNRNSATKGSKKNLEATFHSMRTLANLEFEQKSLSMSKDRFEIIPGQLKIKRVLGSGASGIVRLGCYQVSENHAIDVAVKTLRDDPSDEDVRNFRREILIMKLAERHENIVSIIGCYNIDVARPMLVVEYCSQGDLRTYLWTLWQKIMTHVLERRARDKIQENGTSCIGAQQMAITNELYDFQEECVQSALDKEVVSVADLLSFARQVACGMEFLSSHRIIHRDLAARNVLVCADGTAKISDFGLSRDIYKQNIYKKQGDGRLPIKWMALEALTHRIYTRQSDVWSFGILLWEIVTLGCTPYPDISTNKLIEFLKSGYRMQKPDNCGSELYNMMVSCWHSKPHSRPNFTQLKNQLDELMLNANNNQYLKLYDVLRDPSCKNARQYSSLYATR